MTESAITETVALDIQRLGAQADGIADGPAGPLFVPGALPGEHVEVSLDSATGRARLSAVVSPSADRVVPPCPHFQACGGCAAQHMSASLYAAWKRDLVVAAFRQRGLEPDVAGLISVGPGRRRRATFSARRDGKAVVLGFHEEGSHSLVDIAACPVMVPAIERALPHLRRIAEVLLKPGADLRMAVTALPEGLDVAVLDGPPDASAETRTVLATLARETGIVRLLLDGDMVMQSAAPMLTLAGGARVALPPGVFIQAAAEAEAHIAGILEKAVRKSRRIADLFCGLGTFTLALARTATVFAADGDKAAIAALAVAAKATPGLKPIEHRVRDLMREPLSRTELRAFDAVVLDPPRAGAKAQAEALARSEVSLVCMVSCNPATMSRDCRILVDGGYTIERVTPIDQFVWSPHVEAVAVLRRRR